jgi:hypothetical protein
MVRVQDPQVAGLIASAYHAVRDALAPFVKEQLYFKDKDDWIKFHNGRRTAAGAPELPVKNNIVQWDAYTLIRSIDIDFSYIFRRAFQKKGCDSKYIESIIVQLVNLRNVMIGHPAELIDETQAFIFLVQCRELFDAVKEKEYSLHVRKLLDQLQSIQAERVTNVTELDQSVPVLGETALGDLTFSESESLPQWAAEPAVLALRNYLRATTIVKGLFSSRAPYFRFGFKLMNARDKIFSPGSIQTEKDNIVVHLGKNSQSNDLFLTVYRNGLRAGQNKVLRKYTRDTELQLKLELTKNGIIKLWVEDELSHEASFEMKGPAQLVILAWGDEHRFECRLRRATIIRS